MAEQGPPGSFTTALRKANNHGFASELRVLMRYHVDSDSFGSTTSMTNT